MPEAFIIRPFLIAHKLEVKGMLLTEYNEAETMELFREEGRAEGRAEGRTEGIIEALTALAKEGLIPVSAGAARAGISEEEFTKRMKS